MAQASARLYMLALAPPLLTFSFSFSSIADHRRVTVRNVSVLTVRPMMKTLSEAGQVTRGSLVVDLDLDSFLASPSCFPFRDTVIG